MSAADMLMKIDGLSANWSPGCSLAFSVPNPLLEFEKIDLVLDSRTLPTQKARMSKRRLSGGFALGINVDNGIQLPCFDFNESTQ
jgi:hypothetical protein